MSRTASRRAKYRPRQRTPDGAALLEIAFRYADSVDGGEPDETFVSTYDTQDLGELDKPALRYAHWVDDGDAAKVEMRTCLQRAGVQTLMVGGTSFTKSASTPWSNDEVDALAEAVAGLVLKMERERAGLSKDIKRGRRQFIRVKRLGKAARTERGVKFVGGLRTAVSSAKALELLDAGNVNGAVEDERVHLLAVEKMPRARGRPRTVPDRAEVEVAAVYTAAGFTRAFAQELAETVIAHVGNVPARRNR